MPYRRATRRTLVRKRRTMYGPRRPAKKMRRELIKKKRGISRQLIGQPKYASTCKKNQVLNFATNSADSRGLYSADLTVLTQGTAINNRLRSQIYLSGIKLRHEFINNGDVPLYLNCAVLGLKGPSTGSALSTNNFFTGEQSDAAMNFNTSLSSLQFAERSINTNLYTVLWHRRFLLANKGSSSAFYNAVSRTAPSFLKIDKYIKIGRVIKYDVDGDAPQDGAVYSAFWTDRFLSAAGTAATVGAFGYSSNHAIYFREQPT